MRFNLIGGIIGSVTKTTKGIIEMVEDGKERRGRGEKVTIQEVCEKASKTAENIATGFKEGFSGFLKK